MNILWLALALDDLEHIRDTIAAENPAAAKHLFTAIREAAGSLAQFPNRGRPGRWPGTRELIIPGTQFLVPYRVREGEVEILRVFRGRRVSPDEPTTWKD